jgi:hypothetical protein
MNDCRECAYFKEPEQGNHCGKCRYPVTGWQLVSGGGGFVSGYEAKDCGVGKPRETENQAVQEQDK